MAILAVLRLLAAISLPATAAAQGLRGSASWDWRCSNVCYPRFGFWESDCFCEAHDTWYMWVCPKFQGTPIVTQFCGMRSCGGCHTVEVEQATASAPADAPALPGPAPAPEPVPSEGSCGADYGASCAGSLCCRSPGSSCYQKNEWYAQCRPSCAPGVHAEEPRRYQSPWTCTPLGGHTASSPATPPELPEQGAGYHPLDGRLLQPSPAPRLTYYMYRVQGDGDYAPENQNMANLAGALWYLHNEIVTERHHRRYRKTRIQRFKVTTQATRAMFEDGIGWGVRFAFDLGQCTGPWDCQEAFQRYGYFVGCNNVHEFPTGMWKNKSFYPNAVWYSLPGKCNTKRYWEHDAACELEEPGGACDDVSGMGNCTYSYAAAGEISIDELEGIEDFEAFAAAGGWEYNNRTDAGVHLAFWDDKYSAGACGRRMEQARAAFREKYENETYEEELPEPTCSFRYSDFYAHVPQE